MPPVPPRAPTPRPTAHTASVAASALLPLPRKPGNEPRKRSCKASPRAPGCGSATQPGPGARGPDPAAGPPGAPHIPAATNRAVPQRSSPPCTKRAARGRLTPSQTRRRGGRARGWDTPGSRDQLPGHRTRESPSPAARGGRARHRGWERAPRPSTATCGNDTK